MIEIVRITPHHRNDRWRTIEFLEDGEPKKGFSFKGQEADTLKPGPLPDGWSTKPGNYGDTVFEPPAGASSGGRAFGGGAAAFRNTEAGFKAEQDRMDRRTAVMSAADLYRGQAKIELGDVVVAAGVFMDVLAGKK